MPIEKQCTQLEHDEIIFKLCSGCRHFWMVEPKVNCMEDDMCKVRYAAEKAYQCGASLEGIRQVIDLWKFCVWDVESEHNKNIGGGKF